MANSNDVTGIQYTAGDVARLRNGSRMPSRAATNTASVGQHLTMAETNALYRAESDALMLKVIGFLTVTLVLVFVSFGIMGAAGQYYAYTEPYTFYSPVEVARVLFYHAYNSLAVVAHTWSLKSNEWLLANVPGYWAVMKRIGVVGITLISAVLLSISGMLYQNAFKNPIAGPGMLGVGSGVSLGLMLLVAFYSGEAASMLGTRYLLCYGFGAGILLFVILMGRKLSGKGKPFDLITMLLVGSVLSQFLGFITSYVTLFVMDEEDYLIFYTISQMLVIDTSAISWIALSIAMLVSFIPVIFLRYKMNMMAFSPEEARLLGVDYGRIRGIALVCGAIMILAAQCHVGMVGLVSLIVPFLSRSLFGCEFSKQLIGNICIGMPLLLVCRDVTDLIPFVGDGLAIGSIASVVMLPLFVVVMAKQMRGWE